MRNQNGLPRGHETTGEVKASAAPQEGGTAVEENVLRGAEADVAPRTGSSP